MSLRIREALLFLILFLAYQAPEGIGGRLFHALWLQGVLLAVFFLCAWVAARALPEQGWEAYALSARPGWLRSLGLNLGLAVCARSAALWVGARMGIYVFRWAEGPVHSAAMLAPLMLAVVSTFLPSVAEDVVTRGFWYRRLSWAPSRGGLFVAVSACIYVLNHIYRLANGPSEWLMLFAFGLAYATALARTGTLWAAVGLHWGWNLTNSVVDIVAKVTVARPGMAPLLSSATHLLLLAVVLLLPARVLGSPRQSRLAMALGTPGK